MPGIEDTEQIQYDKINEEQQKNEVLAKELKQKIKVVGTRSNPFNLNITTTYRYVNRESIALSKRCAEGNSRRSIAKHSCTINNAIKM